ncbi:MAG TPA: hypothetical protein VEQ58_02255, partial [Polyangiaceae bacterium]|nr:hypothetical protein [Polyangiaceae bacterium]
MLEARPVLAKGDAERFVRQGSRLRAEVAGSVKQQLMRPATVDLPLKSEGRIRVQPDGAKLGVEFATEGAKAGVDVEVAEGNATFPGAGPHGGDIVLRVTGDGVEDYVVLREKPAQPRVDYTVSVGEVAGLRLYDDTLEFLDKSGDPQLHVKPPRVIDADGVKHAAKLALLGCNADTSGEAPWGRPVTAPGAQDCTLRVTWDDRRVIYPAIVDPVWATTGALATARYRNAAIKLSTGIVLTCGGIGDLGVAIASCEQFNPASNGGLGAWAAATSMNTARNDFTLVSLAPASATNVLAVGGTGLSTSERFNGTNAWAASTGDFSAGYFYPQAPAATSDGNFVVLIDTSGTPYRFNTSTNAWSVGSPSPTPTYRYDTQVLQIPSQNTILRLGGYYSSTYFNTGERYKPSLDTSPPSSTVAWTNPGAAASMTVPRGNPAAVILDSNRLMVYGGYTGAVSASTAEIYNGSSNTWSFAAGTIPSSGSASQYNRGITAAFHGSGKLLLNADSGPYIFDPAAASSPWTVLSTYNYGFYALGSQANVISAGSKVLMVPVQIQGTSGAQTACRLFDFGDKGSLCTVNGECQTGLTCVTDPYDNSQVCCDTACTGACNSCRAANKVSGTADGTCGPRRTDQSMYSGCPTSNSSTCGNYNYVCDGLGSCAKWPATTQCGDSSCQDGDTQYNARFCDGAGTCKAQTQTDCNAGYQCSGSQ